MSGVTHILFINPLLTRLSQVLALCRLHYNVYLILTYSCLEMHRCYLSTCYWLQFDVYQPPEVQRVDSITCVSCITDLWTRLPYFFYINLLIPRVSYVLFINPFRTRVTHVLFLWGL